MTKTMTEMEKQLLSALESLQTSYEQQQQAWQDSYSSLQHMFEATSQALTHSDRVCQHLSSQVESLRAQVELEQERQPLDALIRQHDRAYAEKLREQQPEPQKKPTRYYGPRCDRFSEIRIKCTMYSIKNRRQP
jgi:hypothetical protein